MKTIPIIHCFDHGYVLPAGVAFQSMLERARSPGTHYALHVVGTALTDGDKTLLQRIVSKFPHASLEFHSPPTLDLPAFEKRGNLARDVFFKMLLPEMFPQYDVAIVSDVDVAYADDVASFFDAAGGDDDFYICGTADVGYASWRGRGILRDRGAPKFFCRYLRNMTDDERGKLVVGMGFTVMNLRACRSDGMVGHWFDFARKNFDRLVLLEQDVMNICCAPRVKVVSSRFMAIAGFEPEYRSLSEVERAANPAWDEMFANPVQMHYASGVKPWKFPHSACSELWFEACLSAGLFDRWRAWYGNFMTPQLRTMFGKSLLDIRIPIGKRDFHLQLHKEKRG